MQAFRPVFAIAMTLGLTGPAMAATGSGTVEFRFTSFAGPYELNLPAGVFGPDPVVIGPGSVNGVTPTAFGAPVSNGNPNGTTWQQGSIAETESGGSFPLTGAPTTSVRLVDQPDLYGNDPFWEPFQTVFTWTPATFTNVMVGQQFTLGTLTFQNGSWFGGGVTAADNLPTRMGFRVTTFSDDPQFRQSRNLVLVHTVNAPFPNDTTVLAGQQAAADWVTIVDQASGLPLGSFPSFRVYDRNQTPPGETNIGSVDLIGSFGSLNILGFANPQGGFLSPDDNPLPPVIPGGGGPQPIPEPDSWALLIAGFGLTGAVLRRRRALAVA
jgi:hypothetical protein